MAHVLLADYAITDASQKVNMLGTNWQVTGQDPATGNTPGQTVVVFVELPSRFAGEHAAVSIALTDAVGDPVKLPGPGGEPQVLRIAQVITINRPAVPNVILPAEVPSRVQMLLNFPQGLPLPAGQMYTWRLEIDSTSRDEWTASFYVAGAPPGPVIG